MEPNSVSVWERFRVLSPVRQLVIALIVLFACALIISFFRMAFYGTVRSMNSVVAPAYDGALAPTTASRSMMQSESAKGYDLAYSTDAVEPMPPEVYGGGTGAYEETAYETRAYSATYKTGAMDYVCDAIESWKPYSYVVFEHAARGERICSYTLKVARDQADDVLRAVQELRPTDLNVSTESAKKQLVQYDGQLDILLRKQKLLEETLDNAVAAYDELVALSKSAENVEVLSKVIDSKLAQIERLTQQRIALAAQLQSLSQQMADLEDRIEFVYFNLTVYRYEIVDGDAVKDSWVAALQAFASNVNRTIQGLTLGFILNLLVLAQVVLYLLVLLVVVKYGWKGVKHFWQS